MARTTKTTVAKAATPRRAGRNEARIQLEIEVAVAGATVHRTPSSIARSLRYLLAGTGVPNRLGVTSTLHGEGVTTVSRSLAALIANDWQASTCHVDLNWWKSERSRDESALFPTTLADVVHHGASIKDLPVATSVPGLSMVAAGDVPVSSRFRMPKDERLAKVIDVLGTSYEYLVVDLPPILVTSDTVSLGALCEGYLLVVRQRAASTAKISAALGAMNTAPCLGTVLNDARTRVPRWLLPSNEMWAFGERR